jgi:cytochrome c oxidase subunit 4
MEHAQQHPISIYLTVWGLLFVLSTMSYLVDYFEVQDVLKHFLVTALALLKAGLIVAVFMHMRWERLALVYAILLPPFCLLVLVSILTVDGEYTFLTRGLFFEQRPEVPVEQHHIVEGGSP